jgi:hypothetical protein
MFYDYETNLLIPKSIVILADNLAGGIFDLKRFHCAGGEEVLDEFSDGIYEVIFIFYFRETFYLIIGSSAGFVTNQLAFVLNDISFP